MYRYFLFVIIVMWQACGKSAKIEKQQTTRTGIEVLRESGFALLKGKRIGLITNPTGVDSKLESTIDILNSAPEVDLRMLFGPEHGVRGNFSAGKQVGNAQDEKTALPVFSLYGKKKKPNAEALKNIDLLVYDIQDIGVRSYTFISTMGLAMQAAAEQGIDFVVLDRPNPLGGNRVEGALVGDGYFSFVSQYAIPYIYGLTPGELAIFLNENRMLGTSKKCKLHVVEMQNWTRDMSFADTGLPWVPASPHIPRANSAFFYAASGILGELDANSIGVGYTLPFEVFAAPWLNADSLARRMNAFGLPGVRFRPVYFKPYYMKNKGIPYAGVQIHIYDYKAVRLTEMQFRFAQAAHALRPDSCLFAQHPDRFAMFDKVCGTKQLREVFLKRHNYDDIKEMWEGPAKEFRKKAEPYFLYH